MNKKQKKKKKTPKKVCSTSINQQTRRYYQETAEANRSADGKSRSFRGKCLCDAR